ncbi:DUF5063 domain-containing protein [Georgenia sp. 10Sc9-8]|uniref:DUF5063 domain-containing protein n=1 Tax=Georgenia halotolerans TaxID=3028317 RepID=A0ABT5TZM6_9MICO|nr:DUF5063 domain-containing protein [Georgenia halotolerans]
MPEHATQEEEVADLRVLAAAMATESARYLDTVTEVAAGSSPDAAIPLLLLAVSDVVAAGARLGAITDVVPEERFEPDDGPEPDPDALRTSLANVLDGLDEYREIPDPLVDIAPVTGSLSADLGEVATALRRGLQHYRAGQEVEALWWWQYSYLSSWGDRAAAALRALLSVLGHLRLDVDAEVAAEAEFEALHAED